MLEEVVAALSLISQLHLRHRQAVRTANDMSRSCYTADDQLHHVDVNFQSDSKHSDAEVAVSLS